LARCFWIKDNKDGRESLDTLGREEQKKRSIEKKGRKNESCTKFFKGEWMKESLEEGRRKIGRNNEGKEGG
jgi:hypothetical protein